MPKLLHFLHQMIRFPRRFILLACHGWLMSTDAGAQPRQRRRIALKVCGLPVWISALTSADTCKSTPMSLRDRHADALRRVSAHAQPCRDSGSRRARRRPPHPPTHLNNVSIFTECLRLPLPLPALFPSLWMLLPFRSENSVQKKAVAMVIHPPALPGTFLASRCAGWVGAGWGGGFSSPVTFCNFHSNYITPARRCMG